MAEQRFGNLPETSFPLTSGGEGAPKREEKTGKDNKDKSNTSRESAAQGRRNSEKSQQGQKDNGGEHGKKIVDALVGKETARPKNDEQTTRQRMTGEGPQGKEVPRAEKKPASGSAERSSQIDATEAAPAGSSASGSEEEGVLKIDHLSNQESREIASGVIHARKKAVRQERTDARPGTAGESAVEANALLLEHAEDEIEADDSATVEESLQAAYDDTAREVSAAELPASESVEAETGGRVDQAPQSPFEAMAEEAIEQQPDLPAEAGTLQVEESATDVPDRANERPGARPVAVSEMSWRPTDSEHALGMSVGGTAELPKPVQNDTPASERLPRDWYPWPAAPSHEAWYHWRPHLMRHRHERNLSKKQTKQIEQNLEREVRNVQEQVTKREVDIRQLAAEQMHQRQEQQARAQLTQEAAPASHEPGRPAKLSEALLPGNQTQTIESRPAQAPSSVRRAETMSKDELLRESAGIVVSGVTLRAVYESKRIGEPGLRRLVNEHYRGGDMPVALAREMIEHERAFERDPILRDNHPMYEWLHGTAGSAGVAPGTATTATGGQQLPLDKSGTSANNTALNSEPLTLRNRRQYLLSDTQYYTAGFTLLIVIIVLIIIALQK